jgi:hypothetical protein
VPAPPNGATRAIACQPGDPATAADAIVAAVDAEVSPLRLVLGADSLVAIRAKLAAVGAEISAWERVSVGTAFQSGNGLSVFSLDLRPAGK